MFTQWEVYTRKGKGKQYHGTIPAMNSKDAAWFYFSKYPYTNRVLVRPEGSQDKFFAYRRKIS